VSASQRPRIREDPGPIRARIAAGSSAGDRGVTTIGDSNAEKSLNSAVHFAITKQRRRKIGTNISDVGILNKVFPHKGFRVDRSVIRALSQNAPSIAHGTEHYVQESLLKISYIVSDIFCTILFTVAL